MRCPRWRSLLAACTKWGSACLSTSALQSEPNCTGRANVFVLRICARVAHVKLQLEFSIQGVDNSGVIALKTDEVYSHVVCPRQHDRPYPQIQWSQHQAQQPVVQSEISRLMWVEERL